MKALLASALTALVFVTAAWASNVTPAQLTALSKRVTQLEKETRSLRVESTRQADVLACVRTGWNTQSSTSYTVSTWGGFDTNSGNLSIFTAPAPADGISGTGYLVTVPGLISVC